MSAYEYKCSYSAADNEEILLSVEFVSDGNKCVTNIKAPYQKKLLHIKDQGTVLLGIGRRLREKASFLVSEIANMAGEEEDISLRFVINGKTILLHTNKKTENSSPTISIMLTFTKENGAVDK